MLGKIESGYEFGQLALRLLSQPNSLEEGDLPSVLERFVTQMFANTPVKLVCEAIGEPYPLPKEAETNLLRIGQEALTNVFKHAKASKIRVELGKSN